LPSSDDGVDFLVPFYGLRGVFAIFSALVLLDLEQPERGQPLAKDLKRVLNGRDLITCVAELNVGRIEVEAITQLLLNIRRLLRGQLRRFQPTLNLRSSH
jgi:hypothetical protein